MFKKRDHNITLNFNGATFNIDALELACALKEADAEMYEIDTTLSKFNMNYVNSIKAILEKLMDEVMGNNFQTAVTMAFNGAAPGYYDLLEMKAYMYNKLAEFEKDIFAGGGL